LKRVSKAVTVSLSILVAAVLSIVYAVWIPFAVRTAISFFNLQIEDWLAFVLVLTFNNAGSFVLVSGLPSYLVRERNLFVQFLALIFSNTVASYVEFLLAERISEGAAPPKIDLLEVPSVAFLYLSIPFIIIIYIGIRSSRREDET
jgi:hypothetical protein